MIGTLNQVDWAEQIKARVSVEFDRVAKALATAAGKQGEQDRLETQAMISILEEKRAQVMANAQAGYFICEWQELSDQVRQMIIQDPRYQAIKASRNAV
jgi:hypothetical protein